MPPSARANATNGRNCWAATWPRAASLAGVVLLIDIRRGVTDYLDRRLADFIAPTGRPVLALLTKADKLPYGQRMRAVFAVRQGPGRHRRAAHRAVFRA